MAVVSMTDDELVAAELARLDHLADNPPPGWRPGELDHTAALHAHLRAYGLRHLPVDVAAQILRQEAHDALSGRPQSHIGQSEPVWWLGVTARRAGLDWPPELPRGFEVRARTNVYLRKKIARPVTP